MKKLIFGLLLILFILPLHSQDVVLDMNVEDQYKGTRGPNMRHYSHFYVGGAAVADFDEQVGTFINFWRSGEFVFGYRYKLKLLSFYSIGMDLNLKSTTYFFEGRDENPFDPLNPLTFNTERDRHRLENRGLGLEFYHRINIGRRGNTLGNYIDTGIRGQWNFSTVENILIRSNDENLPSQRTRIKNRRLNYIEPFIYSGKARIGLNKFSMYGEYRISDIFKDEISDEVPVDIPEVPRLVIGFQFAF